MPSLGIESALTWLVRWRATFCTKPKISSGWTRFVGILFSVSYYMTQSTDCCMVSCDPVTAPHDKCVCNVKASSFKRTVCFVHFDQKISFHYKRTIFPKYKSCIRSNNKHGILLHENMDSSELKNFYSTSLLFNE